MLERRIIIGLITSTDYIRQVRERLNPRLFESNMARRLAAWCLEYFDKYKKCPMKDIEGIFYQKVKESKNFPRDVAEDIEEVLLSLNEEYEESTINVEYLCDQTNEFLTKRNLETFIEKIKGALDTGNTLDAENAASQYKTLVKDTNTWLDLSDPSVFEKIETAFTTAQQTLVQFPGALGEFWNDQLIRGAFVALLAPEKRGKTMMLLEIAMKACGQKKNVAFFQAGDMTDSQQIRRIAIYLTKRSDNPKYAGKLWEPVKDCIKNQLDTCDFKERECDHGVFTDKTEKELRATVPLKELIEAYKNNPDYRPCTICEAYKMNQWGCPWIKEVNTGAPLTVKEAKAAFEEFFIAKRKFKLSTHPAGTLTIQQTEAILDIWEKQEGFVPDVILFDYADIMDDPAVHEFRQKQNAIWMGMRKLSQSKHCLVVTATQADADSYSKTLLKMGNFSEDKRKLAHITAMYGLNVDPEGREKEVGVMRLNEIVIREGEFTSTHQVHLLQNLKRGRPFLTSYW